MHILVRISSIFIFIECQDWYSLSYDSSKDLLPGDISEVDYENLRSVDELSSLTSQDCNKPDSAVENDMKLYIKFINRMITYFIDSKQMVNNDVKNIRKDHDENIFIK